MRYFRQISLRAFLALVTGLCIALAVWVHRAKTQERAAKAIRGVHGRVTYEPATSASWKPPAWLVDAVGPDYFLEIRSVVFYPEADESGDEQIKLLGALPRLKNLAIFPGGRTRSHFPYPTRMPGGLTDQGAEYLLEHHPNLRHVALISARLSEDTCQKLKDTIPSFEYGLHADFVR